MENTISGGILGLCVGDALGVPFEFRSRESLAGSPAAGMCGYGTHGQPAGTWSDDASMTLCLLDSLSAGGLDCGDIMEKFRAWLDRGAYTPWGEAFDVGRTTREALSRFAQGVPPLECGGRGERSNGNGSLMRVLPLAFFLHRRFGPDFLQYPEAVSAVRSVSSLTHAHPRSVIACGIYLSIAGALLEGADLPAAVRLGVERGWRCYGGLAGYAEELEHYRRLRDPGFAALPEGEIRSSGYVVDTLEAAAWCLLNTDSYPSCVLRAVNLGSDTDTTAAVAGGLAGMYYGCGAIPQAWRETIARGAYIQELCAAFSRSLEGSEEDGGDLRGSGHPTAGC